MSIDKLLAVRSVPLARFEEPQPLIINGSEVPYTTVEYIKGSNLGIQVCSKGKKYCCVVCKIQDDLVAGTRYKYDEVLIAKKHVTIMRYLMGEVQNITYVDLAAKIILRGYTGDRLERLLLEKVMREKEEQPNV